MEQQNKLKDSLLTFFHNLFDLMVVNCLWLLCCLPVVTAGPATCGLYRVALKLAREEPVHPVKDFFRGIRENLKPGFLLGLGALALLIVAAVDAWFALLQTGWMKSLYLVIAVILAVVWLIVVAYALPCRPCLMHL